MSLISSGLNESSDRLPIPRNWLAPKLCLPHKSSKSFDSTPAGLHLPNVSITFAVVLGKVRTDLRTGVSLIRLFRLSTKGESAFRAISLLIELIVCSFNNHLYL